MMERQNGQMSMVVLDIAELIPCDVHDYDITDNLLKPHIQYGSLQFYGFQNSTHPTIGIFYVNGLFAYRLKPESFVISA